MRDAFGVEREPVSKIVIRTPTRLVRMMADPLPRDVERVGALGEHLRSKHGYERPVRIAFQRQHNLTDEAKEEVRQKRLGKTKTLLPTPKLMDGHHRLANAERTGRKTMSVDWHLRNSYKHAFRTEDVARELLPKDRTKAVLAGAGVAGLTTAGAGGYAAHRHRVAKFDRRLLALGAVPVAAAAVPFWQETPDDKGASQRIARRRLSTARTSDVRAVARGNGFRIGEKDHVARLAHSMRTEGFRESEPMVLERYGNGKMLVRGGHHRLAAAEQAGLKRVPVRVVESDKPAPRNLVTLATAHAMDRHVLRARVPYKKEPDRVPGRESGFARAFNRTIAGIDSKARERS